MLIQYVAYGVLLIVILLCVFYDYKRTVIMWLPAQMLFNAQIAVRYASPAMSLVLAVDAFLLMYYFVNKQRLKKKLSSDAFFLKTPMYFMIASFVLASMFGEIQATKGFTAMIKYFFSGFGIVFLTLKVLKTNKDIALFMKASLFVCVMIVVLGLSESILKDNLWLDFVYFNSPNDETTYGRMFYIPPALGGGLEMRYGMVRARSFFGIHIVFGFACLMYFWLFALSLREKWTYVTRPFTILVIVLLLAGVFIANAKTGYVGLAVILLGLYPVSKLLNIKLMFPLILAIIVLLVYFPQYMDNFYGLYDSKIAEEGGGSTIQGREVQFRVALKMFAMNPLFGNGPGSISILKNVGNNYQILGAESSWMQILPERGLFGAITYLYMYAYMYISLKKKMPYKLALFFLLSVFVMETATGQLDMSIWGVVMIAVYRIYRLNSVDSKVLTN